MKEIIYMKKKEEENEEKREGEREKKGGFSLILYLICFCLKKDQITEWWAAQWLSHW